MKMEEKPKKSIVTTAHEVVDLAADILSVISSPSALWAMVLLNSTAHTGFSGFVTNPPSAPKSEANQAQSGVVSGSGSPSQPGSGANGGWHRGG